MMANPALKFFRLVQKLGYRQELRRTLGFLSNFAVAFSYISVSTGTFSFSLFYLGILAGGPAFFWSWPIVAIGQLMRMWHSIGKQDHRSHCYDIVKRRNNHRR